MNENWSYVVPWLCIGDETSSSILHALQWSDGRLRKACECSIAVVETAEYEYSDQTLSDFFISTTTDLTQSPQLREAAANNATGVLLHHQLSVEVYTENPNNRDRLDDVITDQERQISARQLAWLGPIADPFKFRFRRVQLHPT